MILIAAICLSVVTCAPLTGRPNERELVWDGVRAEVDLWRVADGYSRLSVNLDNLRRDLTVRMPDGRVFQRSEIRPAAIAPYGTATLNEERPPGRVLLTVLFDQGECSDAWGYMGGSYAFTFIDGHPVEITVGGDPRFPERCRPALGNGAGSAMYVAPFAEEQLVDLFGPFRDKRDYYGGM